MIEVHYLKNSRKPENTRKCWCCSTRAAEDPEMVSIKFEDKYRNSGTIVLCRKCRNELYEKLCEAAADRKKETL